MDVSANPKLLRVKVGDTLFDLPNTVDRPSALIMDLERKPEKLGIVNINYNAHVSNPANRWECNRKTHPVADFGSDMGFVYRGDGSEPKDYRMGDKMYAIADIVRYDRNSDARYRRNYLADVGDIEKVRFVRRIFLPRKISPYDGGEAEYEFAYQGRHMKMRCQIWDDSKFKERRDDPRPAYPNLCVPNMPFRAGDILIGVDQRSYAGGSGAKAHLIPPEEWPKQWAYTINKVLGFRVQKEHVAPDLP